MGRNTKEIELFGEKLILSERDAADVLALSEFIQNNNDNNTIGIVIYQSALLVESSLKFNRKEFPVAPEKYFLSSIIRKLKLDKNYEKYLTEVSEVLEYNHLISAKNIIDKLTQKEIFELVKQVYEIEGLKLNTNEVESTEKKS